VNRVKSDTLSTAIYGARVNGSASQRK